MTHSARDVIVVGAGFAGLYTVHLARSRGLRVEAIEAGDGVGGTWFWNRYPGARCDVPSMEYSFGFDHDLQRDWEWTERYATQPEILRYLDHVADRFDLRENITLSTRVESCRYDADTRRWEVQASDGMVRTARFLVMATGCLSAANRPDIPGRDTFAGPVYHTGAWPHQGVDFSRQRVAVIGTGSSAVQSIPLIAEHAEHLTVFQRTPAYAVPAHNQPLDPAEVAAIKADYPNWRAGARQTSTGFGGHLRRGLTSALAVSDDERAAIYERRWDEGGLVFLGAFTDLMVDPDANQTAAEFVRSKIAAMVDDPATASALSPSTVIGCKRMCVDTDYYVTFNRDNVSLVDVSSTPIEAISPTGVVVDGELHEVDAIVFATGFDAMTGALDRIDIRGVDGATLRDTWSAGPVSYLGLQVAGFPNLFTITGPGSPSVLTNMVVSIEQHVELVADLIDEVSRRDASSVEAVGEAQAGWVEHVNLVASLTLFQGCSSWYLGANVPGKPRVFMPLPGFPEYKQICDQVVAAGYDGFRFV